MNNIKKKNILYKLDSKNVLPHTGKGDSITFTSNSNITNTKVNNVLLLFINNDLYLENKILYEMKYLAGPEYVLSIEQISALPNGSKRWVETNDYTLSLEIYRKIEKPLSASIYEIRNLPVNFITAVGDNIFIAFADKLMYDNGSGLIDCKDIDNNDIIAVGYYTCTDGTFFITETSLYELKLNITGTYNYSLIRIDTGNLENLRCITYNSVNNMFYIGGTNSYMARGFYNKEECKVDFISDIKFCQDDVYGLNYETYNYLSNITVNAILLLDNTDTYINKNENEDLTNILVATDAGIFRSDLRYYLNVNSFAEFNDKTCVGIVKNIEKIYVLASDGYLYVKTSTGFLKYTDKLFRNPKALIAHLFEIYIACDDGIYKYTQFDGSEPEHEYDNAIDNIVIGSLDNKNKIVFATKDNIVYYYNNPVIVKNFQLDEKYKIILILLSPRKNKKYIYDLYILATDITNNSNYVFAAYIEFNSEPEYDLNKIYRLSSMIDNCDIITSYNNNCYYIKNNIIYNLVTGSSRLLDDLTVFCIDYSVENDCIALGTNIGLYILDPVTFEIKDILDDNNLTNIKYIALSKDIIYFGTDSIIYAVSLNINKKFNNIVTICNIALYPAYTKFNGIKTYNNNLYIILNLEENGGPILSTHPSYIRSTTSTINVDESGEDDLNIANLLSFPLMSSIIDINISSAIGLSGGIPYKLVYSPESSEYLEISLSGITTNTDPIGAICTVGKKLFVATNQKVYQYEWSADIENFDPHDLSAMEAITSSDISNVKKLVYSGTDTSFDMRIYALTDNNLFVYKSELNTNKKLSASGLYKDFIQYTDAVEFIEEGEEITEWYYNFIGIPNVKSNYLSVNIGFNYDINSEWQSTEYCYPFNDISGENSLTERSPYAIFYPGNSRIYVAYTAKLSNNNYVDCIAALKTDSILSGNTNPELIDTSDFYVLGTIDGHNKGLVRFSGFNILRPESENVEGLENEDIDIITIYKRDDYINKLLVSRVDSNIDLPFANTFKETTENLDDLSLSYFLPDCYYINEEDYYITLPALIQNGDLLIELYKYNDNKLIWEARYYILNINSDINIKDVFVIGSPLDSTDIIEFLIVTSNGNTYSIKATKNEETQWSNSKFILSSLKDIKRFGINQLIGYTDNLIYDFQTLKKYNYSSDITINNVYVTDNVDSADFIFILNQENNNIYVTEPTKDINFNRVSLFNNINFSLSEINNHLFLIDWDNEKIYKEKLDGTFEEIASGNFNTNYVDGCICYDNEIYYLCVILSNNIINIYLLDITGTNKLILNVYSFKTTISTNTYIPFIIGQKNTGINKYLRNQLFRNTDISYYNWFFITEFDNNYNFNYLDFNSDFLLEFKELSLYNDKNYLRIDKNDSILYGVRRLGSKIIIESIINDINLSIGSKLLECDLNSYNGWFVGNMYFFKSDYGLRYYNGKEWNTILESIGNYINIINIENNYYFLKIEDDIKKLYINIKEESFNLKFDPIIYKIEDEINNPILLINSDIYAGLICLNNVTKILTLHILKPNVTNIIMPSIILSNNLTDNSSFIYFISVNNVLFEGLPDNTNIYNIVPIGNSLNELIIYDNLYLYNVYISKNLLDNDVIKININNVLPWSNYNIEFNSKIISSINYNNIKYIANRNGLFAFSDKLSGLVMKIINPLMKTININARSFYKIGQNNFYIPTNNGIYRYLHIDNNLNINRITPAIGYDIKLIISYNFTGLFDMYLIVNAFDNFVYQSENGRVWEKLFKPISVGSFNAIYPKNAREWYFGGNTGLYKSIYQYTEVNDIKKFTESDLYLLYNNLISSNISSSIEDTLIKHEISKSFTAGHLNSLIDKINSNLLSVNFNGLLTNGWQKTNNDIFNYKIQNDIVFELYWGNNIDNNILLSVENQFVTTPNAKFTYLFRRWMSGITEIYINIPTTNTYYINHIPSTPNYNIDEDSTELIASNVSQFGKNKLIFRHNPNESGVYTKMSLALNKSIFNIDLLIGVLACGNSLPLKIYKENINENIGNNDYQAAQYFNSYIAPTVMIALFENENNYIFEFACFGADELVIKLEFIDNVNKFNDLYCRLIFNSNGLDTNIESFVKLRIRLDGKKYKLRRNSYQWPSDLKIFIGWTFTQYPPDNPDISNLNGFYYDLYEITSTEIEERIGVINLNSDVILYAVWITYLFTNNDTTLLLNSSTEKNMFTIGNVEIVNNTKVKDKIIVKFEEIES